MRNKFPNYRRTGNFPRTLTMSSLIFSYSLGHEATATREKYRARFYDDYRKVAEEYDKEFLKKHDEDLNTTLIFVSSTPVLIASC